MLFVRGVTKTKAVSLPLLQTTSKASPEPKTHLSKHVAPGERIMASCTARSVVCSVTQLHGMPRTLPTLHAPLSARRALVNSARRLPRTLASTSAESNGAPTHAAPVAAALPPLPPLNGACAAEPCRGGCGQLQVSSVPHSPPKTTSCAHPDQRGRTATLPASAQLPLLCLPRPPNFLSRYVRVGRHIF